MTIMEKKIVGGDKTGRITAPTSRKNGTVSVKVSEDRKSVPALYPLQKTKIDERVLDKAIIKAIDKRLKAA